MAKISEACAIFHLYNYRKKCWQMLTIEGTTMLEKAVPQCRFASQELTVSDVSHQGMSVTEVSNQYVAVTKVSDQDILAVPVSSDQDVAVPVVSDQDMAVTKVSEQDMAVVKVKVSVEEKETSITADKDQAAEVLEDVDAPADIKMPS